MSNATKRQRFRLRFSVKTLLILMAVVAVYFVGRWNGYHKGLEDARKPLSAGEPVVFWLGGFTDKPPNNFPTE